MGRWARHQRLAPSLEARVVLDQADRPNAVEEEVALQERRVAGIDQRVGRAVEERAAALPGERGLEPLERDWNLRHRLVVVGRAVRIGASGSALREAREVVGPGA